MGNLNNNRIDTVMSDEQRIAVKTAFETIKANMPFLTGLTVDERIALPKINVSNKAFTEDAINAAVNNPSLVASYLSVPNMQNDMALYTQLDEIKGLVNQLLEKIEDTQLLAGSEAYVSGLAFYKLVSAAAEAGVPGADAVSDLLRARFAGQGGTAKKAVNPEG